MIRHSLLIPVCLVLLLITGMSTSPPYEEKIDTSISFLEIQERKLPNLGQYPNEEGDECLVPCDRIVDGGPPTDGIPPIENPKFTSISEAHQFLENSDLIMGITINNQMHGFPYRILDHHEIANMQLQEAIISITYCPLTGTGIPFNTGASTLGTSGDLYENNLVYYDRQTGSYWSQMLGLSIKGDSIGSIHQQEPVIEMTWAGFSIMYPDAKILSRDTGSQRNYDIYPYSNVGGGDYRENKAIIFETTYNAGKTPDSWYHPKAKTVVIDPQHNNTGLIPFSELDTVNPLTFIHNDEPIVIFYDQTHRLAVPFSNNLNGMTLEFEKIENGEDDLSNSFGMVTYLDNLGNTWNMKGVAIAGPNEGQELPRYKNSYNAYWFAAIAFFGHGTLYTAEETLNLTHQNIIGQYFESSIFDNYYWILPLIGIPVLLRNGGKFS